MAALATSNTSPFLRFPMTAQIWRTASQGGCCERKAVSGDGTKTKIRMARDRRHETEETGPKPEAASLRGPKPEAMIHKAAEVHSAPPPTATHPSTAAPWEAAASAHPLPAPASTTGRSSSSSSNTTPEKLQAPHSPSPTLPTT